MSEITCACDDCRTPMSFGLLLICDCGASVCADCWDKNDHEAHEPDEAQYARGEDSEL